MMAIEHAHDVTELALRADGAAPRWAPAVLLTLSTLGATPAYAATCTVDIPEYNEKRSGECLIDDATDTVVLYDADYWGKRGRKLLLPRVSVGRRVASFIAISPTDVRSNDVAHAMRYGVYVRTSQGDYRFEGDTPTRIYQAAAVPQEWRRRRLWLSNDPTVVLTTAQMLAQLHTLKPAGPALTVAVIETVFARKQNLADRLPVLAGISSAETDEAQPVPHAAGHAEQARRPQGASMRSEALGEANRAGKPVASPALDELLRRVLKGGR